MKGIRETYLGRWLGDALHIFNLELRNILRDGGVMIIFVVAGFLYPILYNFVTSDAGWATPSASSTWNCGTSSMTAVS